MRNIIFCLRVKKIATLLAILIFITDLQGQERINIQKIRYAGAYKGILNKATGWVLQFDGKWMPRPNRIAFETSTDTKALVDYQNFALGTDNFISLKIRDIEYKGNTYTAIIKIYRDGFFEYESIEKGWTKETSFDCILYRKNLFDSIFNNLSNDSINYIERTPDLFVEFKYADTKKIDKAILDAILEGFQEKQNRVLSTNEDKYYIQIQKMAKKKKVRFYFSKNTSDSINDLIPMKDYYYEADKLEFDKFIKF